MRICQNAEIGWVLPIRKENPHVVLWSENHMFDLLHKVCGAFHAQGSTVEHMGVDHGGAHILMAQQFLDHTDSLPRSSGCVARDGLMWCLPSVRSFRSQQRRTCGTTHFKAHSEAAVASAAGIDSPHPQSAAATHPSTASHCRTATAPKLLHTIEVNERRPEPSCIETTMPTAPGSAWRHSPDPAWPDASEKH